MADRQQQQLADNVEIVFEKESAIFHDSDHVTGIVLINNKRELAYRCERFCFCQGRNV